MRKLNNIYSVGRLLIWFGSKALLGVSLPHHHHRCRGCIKKTLCYWYYQPPSSKNCRRKNLTNILFSSFSSPFRVLEIKPFVFNETFPCPREQYHLAICLPALILTQYKSEILRIFPFFSFKFLDFETMLCTFTFIFYVQFIGLICYFLAIILNFIG